MNIFDPNRPQTPGKRPAFLTEGSPIPPVIIVPISTHTIRLQFLLRHMQTGYSYSYYSIDIDPESLTDYMFHYINSPEEFLKFHFNWDHEGFSKNKSQKPLPAQAELSSLMSLLEDGD